ncbi:hypothetical protein FQN54_008532 [Arachnomyces sp. PD_36]|nr:hypothetical protein FQN54_008532 [Arachnomyces sp. PD_36]
MDTHDVSDVPEYLQLLRGHQNTLRKAQSRKGQRPRPTKSRDEIIMQFQFRQMMKGNTPMGGNLISSSFVPPAYTPCITPLEDLEKAMIKDLTLETHHRGSYLLLTAVTSTDVMTAVMVIVEDEERNVLMLQLYNQANEFSADSHISQGTVIIVKEPYLKVMSDGDYGLRVDHLSDVVFIPEYDSRVPLHWRQQGIEEKRTADDWKTRGNGFFNEAGYHFAVECYSKALDSSPTDDEAITIKLNRALTFLKTHQFDAALRDLDIASTGPKPSEKALFRKSQGLYCLRRFRESCDVHAVLSREYPENSAAKGEFARAMARLTEQESGKYQFKRLQLEARKIRPPKLDHATYIGPVAVRPTESRGRGLFTTEAVKAGDLLFCEKAFAYAFYDSDDANKALPLLINAQTEAMTMGSQAELIEKIVQEIYKNPSRMSMFTGLYHGSYEPVSVTEVDDKPVVDTFLAERIMSLNCFGCPTSSRKSHMRLLKEEAQPENRVEKFHSCGDLAPNTEITFWYRSPLDNKSNETHMDLKHWGFKCSCVICQDRQATVKADLTMRTKLRADMLKLFQNGKRSSPAKLEALLSRFAETYTQPAPDVPRLGMWDPYLALSRMYAAYNQPQKAIDFTLKTLESLGYIIKGGNLPHTSGMPLLVEKWGLITDSLVGCWMGLSNAYREVAPGLADQAEKYARITYRVCVGEDETFDETYSSERPNGPLVS